MTMRTEEFFQFCRERHLVYLRRRDGQPWPWTDDAVLRTYRFTNIYRELDRTTIWFREHVRDSLRADPSVLLATVLFRWFNRIESGQILFEKPDIIRMTPFDHYRASGDADQIRDALRSAYPEGPYFTGAYMISSPVGYDKLTGVCLNLELFWGQKIKYGNTFPRWRDISGHAAARPGVVTIEDMTLWLAQHNGLGRFMAYEVATDLIQTALLDRAPDIDTWAHAGPGARRGLNRLLDRPRWTTLGAPEALGMMRELLAASRDSAYWPTPSADWPAWHIREVEMSLCEFSKYEAGRTGDGRLKRRYSPGAVQ